MLDYKTDKTGRSTRKLARSRDKKKAEQWPNEPWVAFGRSFFTSFAWRALSNAAVQVFFRLHIEHMNHARTANGKLPCTYTDFEKYGVRRKSISKALDELEALGFIEIIRKGHIRPEGDSGSPSLYRITCLPVHTADGVEPPTNEWRRFDNLASATKAVNDHHENASADRAKLYHKRTRNRLNASSMKLILDENKIQGAE